MKRVLLVIGIILVLFVVTSILASGSFLPKRYDLNKDLYDNEASILTESQFHLIKAGLRASSSHNMQPWKIIVIDESTFELHADLDKSLPVIDPEYQQMLLSQGTFLESMKQGSSGIAFQILPAVPDLPLGQTLIATIVIDPDTQPLDIETAGASTLPDPQNSQTFGISAADSLFEDRNDIFRTWIVEDALNDMQSLLLEATTLESTNVQAMEELLQNFRFSRYQKNAYRYGLSLNTMSPLMQTFVEPLLGLTAKPLSFGASSIDQFKTRLDAEDTYLILSMNAPTAWNYVEIGMWTQRLAGAFGDVASRPAVQILQPLPGMDSLLLQMIERFELLGTPMIVIGFQPFKPSAHESIRHTVADLIRLE